MKRVLVTRARDDAERTAQRLTGLGFVPLISPVLDVAPTGAAIPGERFDGALATSARAIAHAGEGLESRSDTPFYVVGARTAQALARRSLKASATAPDVAALISELEERFGPAPPRRRFLYLAGRDRKADLERFLHESGHDVVAVETYDARAARALSDEATTALAAGEIAAVLHYSTRSAEIFLRLARAALSRKAADAAPPEAIVSIPHIALSKDAARILRDAGCVDVRVAQTPDEDSLTRALLDL